MDRMICIKRPCFIRISLQNILCFGYLLESPLLGASDKYPKHMFLVDFMQCSCIISHQLSLSERRFCDIQIVIIANVVVVSSVGIKRVDCTLHKLATTSAMCLFIVTWVWRQKCGIVAIPFSNLLPHIPLYVHSQAIS